MSAMTARGRDEDGYRPDLPTPRSGARGEIGQVPDAGDALEIQPGTVFAADVGDARPVSLLGLRMPSQDNNRDATVSRRAGRLRLGTHDGAPFAAPVRSARPRRQPAPAPAGWTPDVELVTLAADQPAADQPAAGPEAADQVLGRFPVTVSPEITWPGAGLPAAGEAGSTPATSAISCLRVHVGGFTGGCGRTAAAGLGMALAASRHDPVIAVDVSAEQPVRVQDMLAVWHQVVLVDGPPGWSQPLSAAPFSRADTLVVAVRADLFDLSAADDVLAALAGAEVAATDAATDAAGITRIGSGVSVVVVETVPVRWSGRARRRLAQLSERARAVVVVPFDPALAGDVSFTWPALRRRTRAAFGELAAAVEAVSG
ncbi:hypothetical protein [Frankia sp. CIT1]|uniref:hypothetical protein n=1 Tax=Frankia sp. CIT1 TaxID=2880974 RepID=UPI001EF4F65A|nr:hypothetical protein [Frankia sp. CIT1]